MATWTVQGVYGANFLVEGGGDTLYPGAKFMIDPAWDYSTSRRTFVFSDDDSNLSGDSDFMEDEFGNDWSQHVDVYDAGGTLLYSGQVYAEWSSTFTAPDGSTVHTYTLEIGGTILGEVVSAPLTPGVTYLVSAVPDVTTGPSYASLSSMSFDPDLVNVIQGGAYNDSIRAGAGNDTITTGAGADTIDGGSGNDSIQFGTGGDLVHGGDGADYIDDWLGTTGYVYSDTLYGDAGNDTIYAGAGNDYADGGADSDVVQGEDGNDTIHGGDGADSLMGNLGNDLLYGEADADRFYFETGWGIDTVFGGATTTAGGTDFDTLDFSLVTGAGVQVTFTDWEDGTATQGANTVSFDNIEAITGSAQADTINAAADGSGLVLDGAAGNDSITGGSGSDSITGGTGDDTLHGGLGADTIHGGDGLDQLYGETGNDLMYGDAGADTIDGGEGNDTIWAGADNDSVLGSTGNDLIYGEGGNDTLSGGAGNDTLSGGTGADQMYGDADSDLFRLGADAGPSSIHGGEAGVDLDTVSLSGAGADVTWTGFESGTITYPGATGTQSFWEIERVTGTDFNDSFNATAAGSGVSLDAGAGADTITGSAYADSLTTGAGADTLVLADGAGHDIVTDFDLTPSGALTTDQLSLAGMRDGANNPVNVWDIVVGDDGAGNAVLTFPDGSSLTLQGIAPATVQAPGVLHAMGVPCIVAGMRVATPRGPVPVEDLAPGDLVSIRDGPPQPVLWAGGRAVSGAEMRADPRLLPIEIKAGALGQGRALRLSPLHGLALPEGLAPPSGAGKPGPVLVRAGHLAASGWGGARVLRGLARRPEGRGGAGVSYHHLLLPRHALISVEGLWLESFWPGPQGLAALDSQARAGLIRAMPGLAAVVWAGASAAKAYGPPVGRFLRCQQIDRAFCAKWSHIVRKTAHFDGFVTEAVTGEDAFRASGFGG